MDYAINDNARRTTYYGIDLIKFICSLLVVAIHVGILGSYSRLLNYGIINGIARLAVPFFFTAAGFFVFRKTEPDDFSFEPSLHYAKRILRLYGTWIVILVVGGTVHLWYMGGAVIAVLLVSLLRFKQVPVKRIVLISGLLYIIGLLGCSYYRIIEPLDSVRPINFILTAYYSLFHTTRNGVFMGMIYVSIGMLFAYYPIKMKGKYAIGGFVISVMLLLGESAILRWFDMLKDYDMYVFLVPATFFLFYIATHVDLKKRNVYGTLRVLSALIYFTHLLAYYFASNAIEFGIKSGLPSALNNSLVIYSSTVLISIAISFAIYKLSRTKRFQWLKWLYS